MGDGEHLVGGALFHQAAGSEHADALAPAAGHGQVVADQQQGTAGFGTEIAQFCHHLHGDGHIQAGGGFIGDHQRRVERHGQGNGEALAHAAAELVGIAAVAARIDAHPAQQLFSPLSHLAALPGRPMGGQGVAQMPADRHQRVETRHRILEHQAHGLTAQLAQGGAIELARILPQQLQVATATAAGGQQLQHGPGHGALAAAGGAHQGEAIAGFQGEVEAIERGPLGPWVVHQQASDPQHRGAWNRKGGGRGHGWRQDSAQLGWPVAPIARVVTAAAYHGREFGGRDAEGQTRSERHPGQ